MNWFTSTIRPFIQYARLFYYWWATLEIHPTNPDAHYVWRTYHDLKKELGA